MRRGCLQDEEGDKEDGTFERIVHISLRVYLAHYIACKITLIFIEHSSAQQPWAAASLCIALRRPVSLAPGHCGGARHPAPG